ncbi:acyl-CoA carboxylase subunit epsilon [Microbacterium sp.]|uniref:acyl-CoA carboxylase subunit epsilon n=1 Tax=Microbacterium sp. TaxID=51671 RepID=UPI001AD0E250|nr:acyl-CoA carboxylase subunit epsilon [Microbacterium sp.]MBN9184842.1 acyl-CoA carboxylase subunit epsilon [Microbacterium sp.]MBN9188590.1 acyl-CoA carboxylase subunit epsilon [Microbacterium sp.]MBN9192849.1 acyl-CoA carboxylase subunit epsilon [Microbacterium sp.]
MTGERGPGAPGDAAAETAGSDALRVDVVRGEPTDVELAALIAVVGESYAQEAESAVVDEAAERTAWQLSQRSLRAPLRREAGWGRFSG